MARRHTANALMAQRDVPFDAWMETLRAQNEGAVPKDHVNRIAKSVLRKCDPKQFLLSHATIVASVDAYAPKGSKTGRQMNRGLQVDVKWPDYRIKPECHPIINNNGDAWERSLLLSTYRSFIGAHNYLEHIQLPALSKGFIVDAIARDLGHTCYIDILVATDRKHAQLVADILGGKIEAMSMGCISLFTTCTKCGNVAADDSQLCPCVMYEGKGTMFLDDAGVQHPIAELIGHVTVPNSNQFIEASWVRNPAFRGAVRRNILNPESQQVAARVEQVARIHEVRSSQAVPDGLSRAASVRRRADEEALDSPSPEDGDTAEDLDVEADAAEKESDAGSTPDAPASGGDGGIDSLLDKAQEQLLQIMVDRLGDRLAPKPDDVATVRTPGAVDAGNDNFIRSSTEFARGLRREFASSPKLARWAYNAYRIVHQGGPAAVRAAGLTPRDLIVLSWVQDRVKGRSFPASLYKLAMQVGPSSQFPSETSFLATCSTKLGRRLTAPEAKFLSWKGRIASSAKF